MSATNFSRLQSEQILIWSKDVWRHARQMAFINKFLGEDDNSVIQRVTELRKDKKGARAIMTLVADLEGDGIAGDRQLEGNEEAMKSYDQIIQLDQLRHANTHEGRMAEQKSVVAFREQSKNVLSYWLSDRMDQLAFLTLSGVAYTLKNDGSARTGSAFSQLSFAADVAAPTSKRRLQWDFGTLSLVESGATSAIDVADTISYRMLVETRAYLKNEMIRGVRGADGMETFHVFVTPKCMARLKLDPDFIANQRAVAASIGKSSELIKGGIPMVDGLVIHEHRYVFNTSGLASGSKWGAASTVDGCQVLFCGAQALGMADIGDAEWVEKEFDYDNRPGISVAKMFGFLKPRFTSLYAGNTVQDFGVVSVYVAQ
jgi:N4-gp56 family major capsid protein